MTEILFLVHRLPFPPDKGDKIRSYHLLRYLAARYDVHMACFVDDENDEKYIGEVENYCKSTFVKKLNRVRARAKSLRGFITGDALTIPYYFDRDMANWIVETLNERQISSVVVFSSPMGQYVLGRQFSGFRRVMDFVDIDSDKWGQYAAQSQIPMKWIYSREATLLAAFERRITDEFDAIVFVSENETSMFADQYPETEYKQFTVCNGVATDYFDPELDFPSPFDGDAPTLVFTGVMDYRPNMDAMYWFTEAVLPAIRREVSNLQLWIVGASPTKEIMALESVAGVNVTGRVPDVRPYLKNATAVIAPLRIARGVQNKVLEALAMDRPVICTPHAAAGLTNMQAAPIVLATSAAEFAASVVATIRSKEATENIDVSRRYIIRHYNWESNLSTFDELLLRGHPASNAESLVGSFGRNS